MGPRRGRGSLDALEPAFDRLQAIEVADVELDARTLGVDPPSGVLDVGAISRVVLQSLAERYKQVLVLLENLTGKSIEVIHIVGGGSRNALLCQLVADATGLPVISGPAEATALGNLLMQLRAQGELASLAEMRALVRHSEPVTTYDPHPSARWDEAYSRFKAMGIER